MGKQVVRWGSRWVDGEAGVKMGEQVVRWGASAWMGKQVVRWGSKW